MKRLTVYWAPGCLACEAAMTVLAKWHPTDVVIDRRNVAVCDWKLPDGSDVKLTPTYVLTNPRGEVIAIHANVRKPVLSLAELERFTKKDVEAA